MNQHGLHSDSDPEIVVGQALEAATQIQEQPISRLMPHQHDIRRLLGIAHSINERLTAQFSLDPTSAQPANISKVPQRSRRTTALGAIHYAIRLARQYHDAFEACFTSPDLWTTSTTDPRMTHLQPILLLQRSRAANSDIRIRILMALSCYSLALDFDAYAQFQGWGSRQSALLENIQRGETTAVHRHGNHQQRFFGQMNVHVPDREKLDAALRLGTKLRLLGDIGEECELGHALSLLLVYDCHKLSRLSYSEFTRLRQVLREPDMPGMNDLRGFYQQFNERFCVMLSRYHTRHGQFPDPRLHPATPSAPTALGSQTSLDLPPFVNQQQCVVGENAQSDLAAVKQYWSGDASPYLAHPLRAMSEAQNPGAFIWPPVQENDHRLFNTMPPNMNM